jgi:hypothetical protein
MSSRSRGWPPPSPGSRRGRKSRHRPRRQPRSRVRSPTRAIRPRRARRWRGPSTPSGGMPWPRRGSGRPDRSSGGCRRAAASSSRRSRAPRPGRALQESRRYLSELRDPCVQLPPLEGFPGFQASLEGTGHDRVNSTRRPSPPCTDRTIPLGSSIELVHHGLDPLAEPEARSFAQGREQIQDPVLVLPFRRRQDPADQILPWWGPPHPDPEPRELPAPQRLATERSPL